MTKILLVEDDKSLREIYNVRLRAEGYDIVTAGDGEEALALAIKERPDLIVSDVMMPKISGFDMLDILRSTTETKNIRVIMMTALSSEEQRQRGMALGADRYLVKSQVGIEDVVRTVQEVISGKPDSGPAPLVSSEPASEHSRADEPRPQLSRAPVPTAQAIPQRPQPAAPATTLSPASTPVAAPQPAPAAQPTTEPPSASQPAPVAPVTPAAPTPPAPATTPNPAPQPVQPIAAPAPAAAPTPAPQAPTPTSPPAPAAAPAPYLKEPQPAASTTLETQTSTLPQPVAPFSTPRPGSSGRVIQPLSTLDDAQATDFTARMSQELADTQPLSATPPPFSATETPASPPLQNNSNLTTPPQPSAQIQTAVTTTTAPTPPAPTPQPTTEPPSASQPAPVAPVTPAAPTPPAPATTPNPAPQPVQPVTTPAPQAQTSTNPPTPEALAEQDLADSLAELQFEETARAENAPSQTQAPTLQ